MYACSETETACGTTGARSLGGDYQRRSNENRGKIEGKSSWRVAADRKRRGEEVEQV